MSERLRGKAVVFVKPFKAALHEEVGFPEMDEDGVVIKTTVSGISRGTELDLYHAEFHKTRRTIQWYPLLPGYMPVGVVERVGRNVQHLKEGDRAVASNLFSGYEEPYCCAWGGHVEKVIVSKQSHPLGAQRAVKVPDKVSDEEAAFVVLGAVALHGFERVNPKEGQTVVIIGQGIIGNFWAQLAKAQGCRVIATDICQKRLDIAKAVGIEETVNASEVNQLEVVKELTGGRGADIVVEVTGEPKLLLLALEMARPGGWVHGQGMYLEPVPIYFPDTLFRDMVLSSSCGESPRHVAQILDMVSDGKLKVKPMITHEFKPEQAADAYDFLDKHPQECLGVFFRW